MIRTMTAFAFGLAMGMAALMAEANAATVPSATDTATFASGEVPGTGIQLAHGRHPGCAWGPRRGWWHYHAYGRPYACTPPRYYAPPPPPRCYYDRWGRWICSGY